MVAVTAHVCVAGAATAERGLPVGKAGSHPGSPLSATAGQWGWGLPASQSRVELPLTFLILENQIGS